MQKMGLVREKGGSGKMACEHAPLLFQQMNKQYDLLPEHVNEMVRFVFLDLKKIFFNWYYFKIY